jgi:DNA-binding response OmpR family regulator
MVNSQVKHTPWSFVFDEPTRMLVADDDPILCEFASVYLSSPIATVETVRDGAAALRRLQESRFEIVLLDIGMPELDGFEVLHRIRSDPTLQQLPVMMLTGHEDIESIDLAYHLGATAFATKPVNWRQLSYHIRHVVRSSRAEGLQEGSHDPPRKSGLEPTPSVAERDVREFLQSVILSADVLDQQLSIHDRARCSKPLWGIRSFAKRAFAECSGPVPSSVADCTRRAEVADQRDAGFDNRTRADRRSEVVVELQT